MLKIDITTKLFAGKYVFSTPDKQNLISLESGISTAVLNIAPGKVESPGSFQEFNLYGDINTGFNLQAPNWNYVVYSETYLANQLRGAEGLSVFSIHVIDENNNCTITELVNETEFYLVANGVLLNRIPKPTGKPPTNALFVLNKITDSLADMLNQGSTMGNPLTGAYLAKQDVQTISFSMSDLSYADFTGCKILAANFNGVTATYTQFDQANLTGWVASGLTLESCSFVNAIMNQATLGSSVLISCVFDAAKLINANFNNTTAKNTSFNQTDLTGWVANGLTFANCSFVKANLQAISLVSAKLIGCNFNLASMNTDPGISPGYSTFQGADFTNASLVGCIIGNARVNECNFNGAILINTDFSKALGVPDIIDFSNALLIGANLTGNDLTKCQINEYTNFMSARLEGCNFTGHDLTNNIFVKAKMANTKLDKTNLTGAQLAFADLSFATITGGVLMIGANLSNAILESANFTGAQLGAKNHFPYLPLADSVVLDQGIVPDDMKNKPYNVSSTATVKIIQPGSQWTITDVVSNPSYVYEILKNVNGLMVQSTTTADNAAILSNAFMPNANFQLANLYAVEMSGVIWYGPSANAENTDLGLANLSNAFLAEISFKQTKLQGATFDFSTLIGANFLDTDLNPSPDLKSTSFAFASLQSTQFNNTNLFNANLTNAAFAMENGVPVFTIDASFKTTLDQLTVSQALITAFSNSGYPLISTIASITANTLGSNWTIANSDDNSITQTGYSEFILEYINYENGLSFIQVYGGSPLLVLVNTKGKQEQIPIAFGPTALTKEQMDDNTTCPSGMKLKLLNNHLTYLDLMTAALPPRPPSSWG